MIKNLLSLSRSDVKKFMSQDIRIYEKLDMIYFKIEINKNGVFPKKRPRYIAISDIDCICNSTYKDIISFSNKYVLPHKDELLYNLNVNELTIGLFYLPVHKTKMINYYNLQEGTYILSDVNNNIDLNTLYEILQCDILMKEPIVFTGNINSELIDKILDIFDNKNAIEIINLFNDYNIKPFSRNSPNDIEGYVFRSKNKIFQLNVNSVEPFIEKDITKPYRDIILINLAKSINDEILESFKSNTSYINKICKLFKHFITTSDVFTKYKIDADDLIPPIIGYFGDLDLDAFDDELKTICSVSKLCKNILRMFLHTFTTPMSLNKFKNMPFKDKEKLDKLIQVLNYKNYAEITKNL